ncbi:MAG: hypothetical protein CL596_01170 [Alteromonas sp.]|nr:hypothetical protein [Alteromonas sp.]
MLKRETRDKKHETGQLKQHALQKRASEKQKRTERKPLPSGEMPKGQRGQISEKQHALQKRAK